MTKAKQKTYRFGDKSTRLFDPASSERFGKLVRHGRAASDLQPYKDFAVRRRILVPEFGRLRPIVDPAPGRETQGPFQIQGHKASDLEWRVYRMSFKLGWTDDTMVFQTSILGGRNPGGQMLDFVYYGPGSITVLNVHGDHWHKYGQKASLTEYKEQQVAVVMPSARVYSLYSADLATDDICLMNLRRLIGRGI